MGATRTFRPRITSQPPNRLSRCDRAQLLAVDGRTRRCTNRYQHEGSAAGRLALKQHATPAMIGMPLHQNRAAPICQARSTPRDSRCAVAHQPGSVQSDPCPGLGRARVTTRPRSFGSSTEYAGVAERVPTGLRVHAEPVGLVAHLDAGS